MLIFGEKKKLDYLKKKKKLPKQGREPTVNSALKTRHLWGLNPGPHFKCISREIWGRTCEIKPTNQPLISYLILFVMICHIFCTFYCLKYPFKYRQTPLYGHPLNPLSPNIQVQILQSDLHTFPLRISWGKGQGIFLFSDHFINSPNLISWKCMDNVKRKLMLVTNNTETLLLRTVCFVPE